MSIRLSLREVQHLREEERAYLNPAHWYSENGRP